ncbi:CCAAT-box DNA binding subunit B [Schistosoma japonicum]|nr:CCAAT-box DNA binding subunit B [Schistosoma japonicum]
MCNYLPDSHFTLDYSETYATDSELTDNEEKNRRSSKDVGFKSKEHKRNNQNPKTLLKNINYKSKLSQHNSTIKSSPQSTSGQVSSSVSLKKSNLNNKYPSSIIARWESSQLALADANSIIVQLNKELKDCKLELKTLQRQYKLQAVRLDKAIGQEADMPQIVDRLNAEIRSLQIRLREKTQQSNVDQRKINELYQRIYVLEKTTIDEKHSQSQFNDEESTVSHQRSNKLTDIPIELKVEKRKNSQLQHQMNVLTKNHKQEINAINEKLRCLQRKCQQLEMKLHERTQQLQEKTKLLELQNVHNHRIPKNVIQSHLPTSTSSSSSPIHLTNGIDNQTEDVHQLSEETLKSNNQLIDQKKHSSNDRQSLILSRLNANSDNVVKKNNQDSPLNEFMNSEKTQKLSNDEFVTDNQVTHNNQINESKLQHNKGNYAKTREEQLWNDLFGSMKDNNSETRSLPNSHDIHYDENISKNNFNHSLNEYSHNKNPTMVISQTNNLINHTMNMSNTKQSSWLSFHKTINQLSNELNIEHYPKHNQNTINNNNNKFNCITSHINDVDIDIEELQI